MKKSNGKWVVGLVVGSVLVLSLVAYVVQQIYLDRAAEPASNEEVSEGP